MEKMPYEIQLSKLSELNKYYISYALTVYILNLQNNVSLSNKMVPVILK